MKAWHIAAALGSASAIGVGVWLLVRKTEVETSPENTLPNSIPTPTLQPGITQGWVRGVPTPITLASVGNGQMMRDDAARNFLAMQAAAKAAGIVLTATSGFRDNDQQKRLYAGWQRKQAGDPTAAHFNMAAKPGYSNHQGGTSIDIGGVGSFTSAAYKWLTMNAGRYGFRNDVRGEYWHWTYSGSSAIAGVSR